MKKTIVTMAMVLTASFLSAQSVSAKDQKFINEAAGASLMEIKLGELAQTHGSTQEVKNLGQHMVDDHSKANNDLKNLAAKKNATVPSSLTEKEQKAYDKLAAKQGKEFDEAYAKCMVEDHKKALSVFKKEASEGDDADLKSWASNTVPTLEHHKQMSEETCKSINK